MAVNIDQTHVADLIGDLAKQLGVATEFVYTTLASYQQTQGITDIVLMTLAILILGGVTTAFGVAHHRTDEDLYFFAACVLGFVFAILLVIAPFVYSTAIGQVINPEAYAIKEILGLLKGN